MVHTGARKRWAKGSDGDPGPPRAAAKKEGALLNRKKKDLGGHSGNAVGEKKT